MIMISEERVRWMGVCVFGETQCKCLIGKKVTFVYSRTCVLCIVHVLFLSFHFSVSLLKGEENYPERKGKKGGKEIV